MSIFNRHKGSEDDPWEMMARQDVYGWCPKCKREATATKSTFRNGKIEYRTHCCNRLVNFQEDSENHNNPYIYKPSLGESETPQTGSGRYTKGRR